MLAPHRVHWYLCNERLREESIEDKVLGPQCTYSMDRRRREGEEEKDDEKWKGNGSVNSRIGIIVQKLIPLMDFRRI